MRYKSIEELLGFVDGPVRKKLLDVYTKFKQEFVTAQGSQHNHQAWEGGYIDHVVDAMNIARLLYKTMDEKRDLPFTLSDALITIFLHDIEKAFPQRIHDQEVIGFSRTDAKANIRNRILNEEGIWKMLHPMIQNAIYWVEGEGKNYTNKERSMSPLAAFCNMCDVASARVWYQYPKSSEDTWGWRESETVRNQNLWAV